MNAHNEALVRQLTRARDQLDMAIEDASDDFHGGVAHAEIAKELLTSTLLMARMADAEQPQPIDTGAGDPLYGLRMDSADMGEC